MTSSNITVKSPFHSHVLVSGLWNFLQSKRMVDINFQLNESSLTIPAHRLILEVFLAPEKLLDRDSIHLRPNRLDSYKSNLDSLLEFLYKGEVSVPEQELEELLRVARELDFKMLVDAVETCRTEEKAGDLPETGMTKRVGRRLQAFKVDALLTTGTAESEVISEQSADLTAGKLIRPASDTLAGRSVRPRRCIGRQRSRCTVVESEVLPAKSGLSGEAGEEFYDPAAKSHVENKVKRVQTKVYQCAHCDFQASAYNRYHRHLLVDHGVNTRGDSRRLVCEVCGKRFSSPNQLVLHARVHTRERPFRCPHCPHAARQAVALRQHVAMVHGSVSDRFTCETCGKRCWCLSQLTRHARTHTKERPFKCELCPYASCQKEALGRHCDTKHGTGSGRFTCEVCGKRLSCNADLLRHVRTHSGEPTSQPRKRPSEASHRSTAMCETCGKLLTTPAHLARHRLTHTRERPHQCHQCTASFGQKGDLGKHLIVVHSLGAGGVSCETCGKKLSCPAELVRHRRSHTKEKPFQCQHCGHAFAQMAALKSHSVIVHGLGNSQFACETCGQRCGSRPKLLRHCLTHAKEGEIIPPRYDVGALLNTKI